MNSLGLTFHHIGLAVASCDQAVSFLSELGYDVGPTVEDTLQNVRLNMCTHPTNPAVEIISASSNNDGKGPINELTRKNPSGIVYHTCYATADLGSTLSRAKALGLSVYCVSEPKPAVLFEGRNVSFYKIGGMGLVEIVEAQHPGSVE